MSAKPIGSKPYRISDLIPRNWEGSNENISCRTCTCGCKRCQTKEKQGLSLLRAPTSSTTARLDCSEEEFRSFEAPLNQVLRRTTANEPLRRALSVSPYSSPSPSPSLLPHLFSTPSPSPFSLASLTHCSAFPYPFFHLPFHLLSHSAAIANLDTHHDDILLAQTLPNWSVTTCVVAQMFILLEG